MKTDVAVVDAAEVVRAGIREIVSTTETITLVGEWSTIQELNEFLKEGSTDVVFLGDNATKHSLKHTAEQLLERRPRLKIIVLSASFNVGLIDALSTSGVMGFICKDEDMGGLLAGAIQYTKRGGVYISPQTARTLILANAGSNSTSFSPKQQQVLYYMSQYLTAQEIAHKMEVSVSSVYNLQQRMRIALGVKTSGQILIEATKRRLIGERE